MKVKLDLKSLKLEIVRSGYSINEIAVRPSTAGKIAKALGVDVKSIILE